MLLLKEKKHALNIDKDCFERSTDASMPAKLSLKSVSQMAAALLDKEFPILKNNLFIHDILLYALYKKQEAVQTAEYIL